MKWLKDLVQDYTDRRCGPTGFQSHHTSRLLPKKVRVGSSGRGGVEHSSLELLKRCRGDLTYLTHLVGEVVKKEI